MALLLSACATVTSVKDVTSDQMGYLNKKFAPQSLPPAVAGKLPADAKGSNFGQILVTTEVSAEQPDGKKDAWKAVHTFVDNGNGLIQTMTELSSNDIAYALLYSLSYKGIVPLKWQQVPLRASTTSMLYEIKETSRFDAVPTTAGKEFVVEFLSGSEPQFANYFSWRKSCKTSRTMPASELNAKLPGQAIEFECEMISNNAVQSRSKWLLLQDYGISIQTEDTTSAKKTTSRIVDVKA